MYEMLSINNTSSFNAQLTAWNKELEQTAEDVAKGLAREILITLSENSAQYSGDFAANWNLSVGAPNYEYKEDIFNLLSPEIMGHRRAIDYSINKMNRASLPFTLGQTLYVTNSSIHDEDYAPMIENNEIDFRPGNIGSPMERTLTKVTSKYMNINHIQTLKLKGNARKLT
jgi:hypothetical protein